MADPLVLVPESADELLLESLDGLPLLMPSRERGSQELAALSARVVALANPARSVVGTETFDAFPNLGLVAHAATGYDVIDTAAARVRSIVVTNVGSAAAEEVADTALGLILLATRRLSQAEQHLRSGRWAAGEKFPLAPYSLAGGTAGILGLGHVGAAVARRAEACSMRVAYHSRSPREVPHRYCPTVEELAKVSDVLVVAVPGSLQTRHLVSDDVLSALGVRGLLVNVSRGSVVDEAALIRALHNGRLGGAALDVYEDEPNVPQQLLAVAPDRVTLLPHVGSATLPTRRRMAAMVRRNIDAWLEDRTVLTPVPEVAASPWVRTRSPETT